MPVHHVREALGSWTVNLQPTTPTSIIDGVLDLDTYGFSHLIILPEHIPTHVITDTTGLSLARYTGLYRANNLSSREEGEPVNISGPHLAALLGDEDGKGDNFHSNIAITTRPFYDGSNTSYLKAVADRGNGLTVGTATSAASPTGSSEVQAGDTARQLLDYACSRFGKEWRVNPNGTIDANTKANLYPTTTTPTVAFLPEDGGTDGALVGIDSDVYRLDSDLEDFNSKVVVHANTTNAIGSASITSNPYVGFTGSALTWTRVVDSKLATTTNSSDNVAATRLARWDETRRHVRITARRYDIEAFVQPGDGIYVFDPDQGLYNTSVQVHYRGRIIFPVILRVEAIRWPIEQGMGVYLRYWTGSVFSWFDLTDWVLWEDRPAELEIGDVYRTLPTPRPRLNA